MYHLRLIKAISYTGVVEATKQHPDVFVEDKATADAALATGYFKLVGVEQNPDDGEGNGQDSDDGEEGQPIGKKLREMTVSELETCAAYHTISLNGLAKKADILAKISEELNVDPDDVVEYGSPTMVELQDQ